MVVSARTVSIGTHVTVYQDGVVIGVKIVSFKNVKVYVKESIHAITRFAVIQRESACTK